MSEEKMMRLSQAAKKAGISVSRAAEYLGAKGFVIENNPNSKITSEQFDLLMKEFESSANETKEARELSIGRKPDNIVINATTVKKKQDEEDEEILIKNLISDKKEREKQDEKTPAEELPQVTEEPKEEEEDHQTGHKLQGIKVLGKIDLEPKTKKKVEKEVPQAEIKKEEPKKEEPEKEEPVKEIQKVEETPVETVEEVKKQPEKESVKEPVKEVEPVEQLVTPEKTIVVETKETPEGVVEPTELIEAKAETLKGLTVLGKIVLPVSPDKKKSKPEQGNNNANANDKKKRKRITSSPVKNFTDFKNDNKNKKGPNQNNTNTNNNQKGNQTKEVSDKEIQEKIKSTLAKLSGGGSKGPVSRAKYRKDKRNAMAEADKERELQEQEDAKILKVSEFISANDLASMMNVSVNEVIKVCLGLGMFVSINQRLDAEAITVIADEFGFDAQFVNAEEETTVEEIEDDPDTLEERAPIVTIMGHVDHGKTSLLDYIRKTRIAHGEAGGITQHVGAYDVKTDSGKRVTFLDTPGHEAFTAMRARGAKITDIVIIVVAADDSVMPQTKEAINHAMVAGVPIIIAINKVDKPAANPDKIKEELAKENILVEDWGGKYQCELVSAKSGIGIPQLLEKVLLEAELLQLKANPNRNASGSVIEASLDKGRGYVANVMVQTGTLHVGDIVLAGANFGRVRAMLDHMGKKLSKAGPSTPVQILGLNGAPQAGDKLQVMDEEREAREIATKREQLMREQSIRTKKHITLDEIGRRLAIGNFKELNIIVKGDVDGSVEALSDSLLKLSTEEIQVRIIHKAVGAISESDVLLASASDAVIVGFQVRPTPNSRKLAEKEQIEIRMYSIIYDAINDVKAAMEGMLEPKMEEFITATIEIRQVFNVSKIGAIAGCYVLEGMVKRNHQVRLVRDGIVMHTGKIESLKRVKDDVSEVKTGFECGMMLQNYNAIEVGDIVEAFEMREVKRKL
ncbi:MAG: translation initiation factor IF-2 [Cytophagaceae bacterium]|jgi:translation initiation factor IF-2|nr:translation initiation factor IF-2 [Cytophagaceae bacterium]